MSNNIHIHKENDFSEKNISSMPLGINNISINNQNVDLKREDINNIKPMLSSNKNLNVIEGKKVRIKPSIGKKVPAGTFSMMANQRKNNGMSSEENTEDDDSATNDILSNNSGNSNFEYESGDDDGNNQNFGQEEGEDDEEEYEEEDDEDDEDDDDDDDDDDESTQQVQKPREKTYEEIQSEKQKLLFGLERLQKQGYPPSKKYSMASSYDDLNYEFENLKRQRDVEKSIKFSRKILMAVTSGVEYLNGKFDPFDIKLEGWSENMMENVGDYDEVFEELHDKYGESVKMAPELKLLCMVAGSGFMFHLTNSLFKSASPKLGDILKNNPDIMRNISEAAAKNVNGKINEEFGENDFIGNMMKTGINNKVNGPSGPQNMGSQGTMRGPQGIDDLINELNDDESVSSDESLSYKSSIKKKKNKKGGIQLDLT